MEGRAPGDAPPAARRRWLCLAISVASFHLAWLVPALGVLVLPHVCFLILYARLAPTPRQAFYGGLAAGMAVVGPWMGFLLGIFGYAGVALWGIVAFWTGLFVLLARSAFLRLSPWKAAVLVPFLWTGIEYFRCELYPLKFTWLTPGFAFFERITPGQPLYLGVHGIGFLLAALAAATMAVPRRWNWIPAIPFVLLVFLHPGLPAAGPGREFRVAGLQLEGADADGIPRRLDALLAEHPWTDLVVLPEYAFAGPIPDGVRAWCRRHRKHLVAGGMDVIDGAQFRNTAFVIGPDGNEVFRQVKSVPIQFFRDGLPATEQRIWESPWGRVGIAICYDLSYTRVVDRLVEMGAQVIVAPTMDARGWGETQHHLHARVAPTRAAEYGIPIVRVCSSGISQIVDPRGRVVASAPFPGEGDSIAATVVPVERGRLPWDRRLAPFCTAVAGAWMAWAFVDALRRRSDSTKPAGTVTP